MQHLENCRETIQHRGFCILPEVFNSRELHALKRSILFSKAYITSAGQDAEFFAMRKFFSEVPDALSLIFTDKFNHLIDQVFGPDYFITRATYFDKPPRSSWFVPYHQDLTIAVTATTDDPEYRHWVKKADYFSVQPPLHVLQNNFSIRIHLDETGEKNGALRVIPTSHNRGIYRPETIDWSREVENICRVPEGGVMLMSPLLLHASNRSTSPVRRRVIHIDFSNRNLAPSLDWAEKMLRPRTAAAVPVGARQSLQDVLRPQTSQETQPDIRAQYRS
jgi:ectoine hydroxylase-related dioxygenase (phytanoyl-CoA dioxygenase family)